MSELIIRPHGNIRKLELDQFTSDLQLLLEAFCPSQLAQWMGRDKGNLSKKLNGIEPITAKDLVDFYGTVSSVVAKLRMGVSAYRIELEMTKAGDDLKVDPAKNIWEEIRLLKERLQIMDATIKTSKNKPKIARKRKNGHRRFHMGLCHTAPDWAWT